MAKRWRYALLWCATAPYFWTFLHFTLKPIHEIEACQKEIKALANALRRFKSGKAQELKFIKVAVRPIAQYLDMRIC